MAKKHIKTARTAGRGMGEAQPNVSDDQVAHERAQMLVERQAELDGVLDRHDDMVRVLCLVCMTGSDLGHWGY